MQKTHPSALTPEEIAFLLDSVQKNDMLLLKLLDKRKADGSNSRSTLGQGDKREP